MKCRLEGPNTVCERCTRKSLDCVFEKHRRGRKSTRSLLFFHPPQTKQQTNRQTDLNPNFKTRGSRRLRQGSPINLSENSYRGHSTVITQKVKKAQSGHLGLEIMHLLLRKDGTSQIVSSHPICSVGERSLDTSRFKMFSPYRVC